MASILRKKKTILFATLFLLVIIFIAAFFLGPFLFKQRYIQPQTVASVSKTDLKNKEIDGTVEKKIAITHVQTPSAVKAVYLTSYAAGVESFRKRIMDLINTTEINSVVIDIKDYSGHIGFIMDDPLIKQVGSAQKRVPDIVEFINILHSHGVYVIGRIAVFQDPFFVLKHPELAVKKKDGTIWRDHKGISWLDAGSKDVWNYVTAIGLGSYALGFDELNFDYIRFPSDGDMKNIAYPISGIRKKSDVVKDFFSYLHQRFNGSGAKISADLFGMTTTNRDDLNIGQLLENALPYFDYIDPMVYPSHYPSGFMGFKKPAEKPYEVVNYALDHAVTRAGEASTTPLKIRPWLQDFNLGAIYTADMVRAQIKATYDAGLNSWLLWDPNNRYTKEALNSKTLSAAQK